MLARVPCQKYIQILRKAEPRGIAIDPTGDWVLVGNQKVGSISSFSRNAETGQLTSNGKTAALDQAVSFLFA